MKQKITHKIVHMPIGELRMYSRNARTHSGEQVKRIAESIQEFGFLNPILLDSATKEIIAGHGRLLAARELGLETVPVVIYSHLTAAQKKAYTLADNKLALDAGWDEELLKLELEELKLEDFDLDMLGFDDSFFKTLEQINDKDNDLNESDIKPKEFKTSFELIITCENEDSQEQLYNEFQSRGIECKIL